MALLIHKKGESGQDRAGNVRITGRSPTCGSDSLGITIEQENDLIWRKLAAAKTTFFAHIYLDTGAEHRMLFCARAVDSV